MKWQKLSCAVLLFAFASLAGQLSPTRSWAQQPFEVFNPESIPLPIEAQPATIMSLGYTVDARLTPAEPYARRGPGLRPTRRHELLPKAVFDRIKAAALHNPYAPFDPFARSSFEDPRALLTPLPKVRFPGLTNLDGFEPPDMALAVSPNWVAQGVNNLFAIYSRSGILQHAWPKSFASFFHVPPPACNPTPYMFDPRAFYIIPDQRFVLAAQQFEGPPLNTCAPLSKYWIAVSKTNNPNGAWNVYSFDMMAGTTNLADFTQLGYDANGIYFSGNMFDSTYSFYQYAEIFGASKAKMEAGLPVAAHGFIKLKARGILVDTVQPVESLTQPQLIVAQPVEFFINSQNYLCSTICSGVTVWAFANVLGTPSLTAANIATRSYSFPPPAAQPSFGTINTDDLRINGAPAYQGGLISFGLNTAINHGSSTVAGLFWGQVKPTLFGTKITGGSVFQSGYLSFTGDRSAYYGALVPDSRGNLFMGFGSSSSSLNAGGYYVARKATDPKGTFEVSVQLFKGQGFYGSTRWGDYSAAAIDGNLTTSEAWLALEYANSFGDWATEIGGTRFP